jgi:pimeloyl-ACP methyl ester carboxylesterase
VFDSDEFNDALFYPRRDWAPPPAGAVDLDVEGEATLHLRWHGPEGLPTLLLFHGNGEVVSDYDDVAEMFASAGARLAVVDYRGYGRSAGTPTLRAAIADATRTLATMLAAAGGPVVVMGRSLGSACAAELYGAMPEGVVGFVYESGFVDLAGLIRRRGMEAPRQIDAADLAVFDPVPKLARGTRPFLVLHGAEDALIPAQEAEKAFAAAGTKDKELVLVPDRGHNDLMASRIYWDALRGFLASFSQR